MLNSLTLWGTELYVKLLSIDVRVLGEYLGVLNTHLNAYYHFGKYLFLKVIIFIVNFIWNLTKQSADVKSSMTKILVKYPFFCANKRGMVMTFNRAVKTLDMHSDTKLFIIHS